MSIRNSFLALASTLACSALATVAIAADAATVITVEETDGAAKTVSSSIEVSSWSWGASNTSTASTTKATSGGGAGKVNVQDLSRSVVSPRDAASGLPTGKRMHKPATVNVELDSGAAAPSLGAPKIGEATTLIAEVQESETVANSALVRACATGKHIAKATLTAHGRTTELKEVLVSSCAVTDNVRRIKLVGHVSLLK